MNERIKLLAEQVVTRFDKDMNGYMEPEELGQWVLWDDLQNLAELIVQECANLFEVEYGESVASGNEVARVMKRHFGVK